jgi:hypothetical protein
MARKLLIALLTLTIVSIAWATALNQTFSSKSPENKGNVELSYTFTVQEGYYLADHTLYVSVPPSVHEYYAAKNYVVNSPGGYAKLVTPEAVKSIAENIRIATNATPYADEEFANAVLAIVHEIPYMKSNAKYSVETLVDNEADCDGLSILAASLMKAGDLDVVLLLYSDISPPHMNIGVRLDQMPVSHSWWTAPSGIEYDNKTYWVAECTSLADWTVGDNPRLLTNAKPQVIPLTNCEKHSPAKVTSSLDSALMPSSTSITLTAVYSNRSDERIINISGSMSPNLPDETVTLYVSQPGYAPTAFETATDEFGNYAICWNTTLPGTYVLKTSWSGFLNYSGSDSDAVTVFIGAQQPVITEWPEEVVDSSGYDGRSPASSPWYFALLNQGSKDFLEKNLTGTDVTLSGDFMVLSDGHEITPNDTVITIPAHKEIYRLPRSRQTVTVQIPERQITIPGAELLDSQFGFTLEQNVANNYTARLKTMNDNDLSEMSQNIEIGAVVLNASDVTVKNVWHKAEAKVSGDKLTAQVYDEKGTLLKTVSQNRTGENLDELGILITYPTGQIIAFKNLKAEATSRDVPQTTQNVSQGNGYEFLYPYIRVSLLLAGITLAIVSLWQKRKAKPQSDAVQEAISDDG